jgi:hypothetical protein
MWRAMQCLLVMRAQANNVAPNRRKDSDGLVGDAAHTTGDHVPHVVAGVGTEIVTAEDFTHDPANGFDSYRWAETLRRGEDDRIKYVISNRRMFSSYDHDGIPAWTWRPYDGSDPHTNHCHVSVLDSPICDTGDPFDISFYTSGAPMNDYIWSADPHDIHALAARYRIDAILKNTDAVLEGINDGPGGTPRHEVNELRVKLDEIAAQGRQNGETLSAILALLQTPGTATAGGAITVSPLSGTWTVTS